MNCFYTFKGEKKSHTYQELVEMVRSEYADYTDIIYSKGEPEILLDSIYELIKAAKKDGQYKNIRAYEDGEPLIDDGNSWNTLEFIDTGEFKKVATSYNTMVRLAYIDSMVADIMADPRNTLTEEQAQQKVEEEVAKWDVIGKDAAELHKIISNFDLSRGLSAFELTLRGTKFSRAAGQLYLSLKAYKMKALGIIARENGNTPSKVIYNINLKAPLEGLDKDLFGHIDMIAIDGSGDVHLFNYKVTTSSLRPQSVKMEKYKYLMALLKLMLAKEGILVRSATLNIVPIRIDYNPDFSLVTEAFAADPIELTADKGRYVFDKYDKVAQHFIRSKATIRGVSSEDKETVKRQLKKIFVDKEISADGMQMTAEEWIKNNRASILDSTNPEYAYVIEFGEGDTAFIRDHAKPEHNSEIIEEVKKRLHLLDTTQNILLQRLMKAVRGGVLNGSFSFAQLSKAYSKCGAYLNTIFNKYFRPSKETPSDWEFVEDDVLNSAGIMLFRHKNGLLDVVALSPYDLTIKAKFKRNNDSIVGGVLSKRGLNELNAGDLIHYKPTYANIETTRVMLLLNLVLPKILGDITLGKLHVVSLQGNGLGVPHSLEHLNKELFINICTVVNSMPGELVLNNFTKHKFVDLFLIIVLEFEAIVKDNEGAEADKRLLIETGYEKLLNATTVEAKRNALLDVEKAMREIYSFDGLKTATLVTSDRRIGLLYQDVVKAISIYSMGEASSVEQKMSSLDQWALTASKIPDRNVRMMQDVFVLAVNTTAEKAINKWNSIRGDFFDFYDAVGYTRAQNSTLGGLAKVFDDLFMRDVNGNKLLRLLNPYDENDMALIKTHRDKKLKFLKKVLFEFAKVKYPMKGIKFNFTSENDPALLAFIEQHRNTYFNIPLERASKSTERQNYSLKKKFLFLKGRMVDFFKNPKKVAEELVTGLNKEEIENRGSGDIDSMSIRNKFAIGEGDGRNNYIAQHGVEYFETNLENLLIDFIELDIQCKEMELALLVAKGLLFQLDMMGENPNLAPVIEKSKKAIENFLKVNMFNMSIMDDTSLVIVAALQPLRRMVSDTLIAGNVIAGFRDTFEGVWQNTMRTLNHYQTDITKTALAKAYKTVIQNSFTDGRSINIVNQLCLMYRLSNIDVARISEGLKSERGATNYTNWMYATLRRPDFLNRMTLFVAKCYQDGVYDAFEIKDGKLTYDWRKDKRFSIFADKSKEGTKEYKEQMGAYYNAIRAYNLDHPEATIGYNDDLPMPYSFQEVEVMKNLANSIYGAYDKSTRAGYEHLALGTFLGMFSTWMNGIYSNYMMKPGQYANGEFKLVLARNASGNLLFFDDLGNTIVLVKDNEGNVKYYYEGTETEATEHLSKMQPVMDKVPIIIQGIWYTLQDAGKALLLGNFKEDIWLDPMLRKNLMKLFSDLLAMILFGTLFGLAITPAYNEFKKGMKERDILSNAATEVIYKASSRSYDGFKGMWNVFEFFGENTNPPIWAQNMKLLKDTGGVVFGDKTITDALNGNVAVFKAFQHSWRAAEA